MGKNKIEYQNLFSMFIKPKTYGEMMKRFQFSSIVLAAILIVLICLNPAIGDKELISKSNINSPLFFIRSKDAISKNSISLNCNFLGEGVESDLDFSSRDIKMSLFNNVINLLNVKKTDDLLHSKDIDIVKNVQKYLLRSESIKNEYIKQVTFEDTCLCTIFYWQPGCWIGFFFYVMREIYILIGNEIFNFISSNIGIYSICMAC